MGDAKRNTLSSRSYHHLLGLIAGASAGLFYALGNSLVQYVYRHNEDLDLSEFQIIFVRSLVQFVLIVIVLGWKKINPLGGTKKNFALLMLMGLAKFGSIVFFYGSLAVLPLGDATVIMFTAPVFTLFLGVLILKERFSVCNFIFGILSFVGVAIIAAPGFFFPSQPNDPKSYKASHSLVNQKNVTYTQLVDTTTDNYKGVLFGIAAAVALSSHMIILKKNTMSVDYQISILYPSVYGLVCSPLAMVVMQDPIVMHRIIPTHWLLLITTGFSYFIAMMLLAYALTQEDTGPVALVRNSEVLFAFIFEAVIENQRPMMFSIIGVVLIVWTTSMIVFNRVFNVEKRICRMFSSCCSRENLPEDDSSESDDDDKIPIIEQYQLVPNELREDEEEEK